MTEASGCNLLRDVPFEELVVALRENTDGKTWNDLFARILPRVSLALRRRFPDEFVLDAVQSACRTFLRRVKQGQFQLGDLDAVASLLVGIAYRKCGRMHRRAGREQPASALDSRSEPADPHAAVMAEEIEQEMEAVREARRQRLRAAMADQLERMLDRIDHLLKEPMHRKIFHLLFQKQYGERKTTQRAVAAEVGCSERTVRRVWEAVREEWQPLVEEGQRVIRRLEAELTQGGE